jgi:hypothetical protein
MHLIFLSSWEFFYISMLSLCKLLALLGLSGFNENISMVSSMVSIVRRFMDNTHAIGHTIVRGFGHTLPWVRLT